MAFARQLARRSGLSPLRVPDTIHLRHSLFRLCLPAVCLRPAPVEQAHPSLAENPLEHTVLDDMDHYIKEVLRIKGYVRYMDDFILIHESKAHLQYCLAEIARILTDLGLELNKKKTGIQPVKNGIHFLGFSFRLTDTGKVLQTVLHKKVSKERRKLRKLVDRVNAGEMTRQHVDECYKAWRAHVEKGNCQSLLSRMDSYYVNLYNKEVNENVQVCAC